MTLYRAPAPARFRRLGLGLATVALSLAAACADTRHHYPSLLPRPIEQREDLEPVRPHPALVPDPALDTQVTSEEHTLAAITARADPLIERATAAVAAAQGAKPGSDAWLEAQRALSALVSPRTDLADLAARLDDTSIERAHKGQAAYPALEGLRARVEAELTRVSAKIDDLSNQLK
ncbi:hypothetical protein ACLB0R_00005 [Sphingomonas sp. GlSt437]|uniref:hypothetical protein n=1 Tax=Sphingomonas sp. GlSt437 TaxID=3389970 RepID=UPI003A84B278